jgi:class 3 adenylate cyclase
MQCPNCQCKNRDEAKFCLKCGTSLGLKCPRCDKALPSEAAFCDDCGLRLEGAAEPQKAFVGTGGERKHVTVLFSDLTGYTAVSERLDPEEVKEITSGIFKEVSRIIDKYEGFVEKFVGDAVMAIFGVPKAHEDDPVRAIRAAREIHEVVDRISPQVAKKVGQSISMHTGEVDMAKGTHGLAGDAINVASRLSSLAKPGEILVGSDTYRQAEGYSQFLDLKTTTLKGKEDPFQVYKAISPKERPVTIHRLSGLRADLIGRKAEMTQLREAVDHLRKGRGRIFSICGDAGTGKSRLVDEFKAALNLEGIQ